jgi:hypothetical protein
MVHGFKPVLAYCTNGLEEDWISRQYYSSRRGKEASTEQGPAATGQAKDYKEMSNIFADQ